MGCNKWLSAPISRSKSNFGCKTVPFAPEIKIFHDLNGMASKADFDVGSKLQKSTKRQTCQRTKDYLTTFMKPIIPVMSVLANDLCSPDVRFFSWIVPASASLPPLMERNGMDFFSA